MKFIQTIFGGSPATSIAGYLSAGLLVAISMRQAGDTNWENIALAAALAMLGRFAKDTSKITYGPDAKDVVGGGKRPGNPPTP